MLVDVVVCSLSEERRSVLLDTFPTKVYVYNVSSTTQLSRLRMPWKLDTYYHIGKLFVAATGGFQYD